MPNRKSWLIAAAAAAIAGVVWLAMRPSLDAGRVATRPGESAPPPVHLPADARVGTATPAPAAAASAPKHAADTLCIVKPPPALRIAKAATSGSPFVEVDAAPPPSAALLAGRRRIEAALRASPDPYANAVAVWLAVPGDEDREGHLADERRGRLAALAADTRDPRLYALALRSCRRTTTPACASLNPRRWAELDPGNAMPWTFAMDDAAEHGDAAGVREALSHITASTRIAEGNEAPLVPLIDAASGDDADLAAALSLAADATALSAAQVGSASLTACRLATPAQADTWQQCLAMRDLLEHHSDSLMLRMTGASLDQRLSGSDAASKRVAAQVEQEAAAFPQSSTGCADLRRQLAALREAAIRGPVDATATAAH